MRVPDKKSCNILMLTKKVAILALAMNGDRKLNFEKISSSTNKNIFSPGRVSKNRQSQVKVVPCVLYLGTLSFYK